MAERIPGDGTEDRNQFAAYVAELASELAATARRYRLDALGYLLDMAQLEAKNTAEPPKTSGGKAKIAHS